MLQSRVPETRSQARQILRGARCPWQRSYNGKCSLSGICNWWHGHPARVLPSTLKTCPETGEEYLINGDAEGEKKQLQALLEWVQANPWDERGN